MISRSVAVNHDSLLKTLADFRYELRRFLHFSEGAAEQAGIHPQQHQLLLQVAGAPEGAVVTIAYAAERLGLRHNSAVELVDRSEHEGLLTRTVDEATSGVRFFSDSQRKAHSWQADRRPCAGVERTGTSAAFWRWSTSDCTHAAEPDGGSMISRPSALRDFTVDRRVWLLTGVALIIGTGAAA